LFPRQRPRFGAAFRLGRPRGRDRLASL